VVRPRDAVQWALYYPPVIHGKVREDTRDPSYLAYRAQELLAVGSVDEAEANIVRALRQAPNNSEDSWPTLTSMLPPYPATTASSTRSEARWSMAGGHTVCSIAERSSCSPTKPRYKNSGTRRNATFRSCVPSSSGTPHANNAGCGRGGKGAQVASVVAFQTLAPARQAGRGPEESQTVEIVMSHWVAGKARFRSAHAAHGSATEDPRFPSVSIEEMDNIVIEISILTPPKLIEVKEPKDYLEKIVIGRDVIRTPTCTSGP